MSCGWRPGSAPTWAMPWQRRRRVSQAHPPYKWCCRRAAPTGKLRPSSRPNPPPHREGPAPAVRASALRRAPGSPRDRADARPGSRDARRQRPKGRRLRVCHGRAAARCQRVGAKRRPMVSSANWCSAEPGPSNLRVSLPDQRCTAFGTRALACLGPGLRFALCGLRWRSTWGAAIGGR